MIYGKRGSLKRKMRLLRNLWSPCWKKLGILPLTRSSYLRGHWGLWSLQPPSKRITESVLHLPTTTIPSAGIVFCTLNMIGSLGWMEFFWLKIFRGARRVWNSNRKTPSVIWIILSPAKILRRANVRDSRFTAESGGRQAQCPRVSFWVSGKNSTSTARSETSNLGPRLPSYPTGIKCCLFGETLYSWTTMAPERKQMYFRPKVEAEVIDYPLPKNGKSETSCSARTHNLTISFALITNDYLLISPSLIGLRIYMAKPSKVFLFSG